MKKQNENKGFNQFINNKLMPAFSKLSTQRHLVTIRDAFGIITPLIIAGAISLIGAIFIFGDNDPSTSILGWIAKASGGIDVYAQKVGGVSLGAEAWHFTGAWITVSKFGITIFETVTKGTIGLFSIFVAFEISYIYTKAYKEKTDAVIAGLLGIAAYGLVSHGFSGNSSMFLGANGLLIAILISFITSFLFDKIGNIEKLKIKMPKEVPPAVALGFSYIIPILLTLLCIGTLDGIAWLIGYTADISVTKQVYDKTTQVTSTKTLFASGKYGFSALFFKGIGAPFHAFTSSKSGGLGIAVFYSFFVAFFWWFGLNGSSVMNGVFSPILTGLVIANSEAVASLGYNAANASGQLSTVSIVFLENYTQLTGWGMTGALIIGTFIASKIRARREIAKLASVPAIFNVNEPMTFGFPIMLNPIYAIPSMIIMPLNAVLAFLVVDTFGWVHKSYLFVPWTVPPGVGALLATGFDWRAFILAWFCLAVAFGVYLPFVLLDNFLNKDLIDPKEKHISFRKRLKGTFSRK